MALTKCGDCGQDVSTAATSCPKCGRPVAKPVTVGSVAKQTASGAWTIVKVVFAVLLVAGIVAAVKASQDEKEKQKAEIDGVASSTSAPEVSARELVSAYTTNEVAADNAYKGKVYRISGVVSSIGKDILDHPFVTLKSSDVIREVQCTFDNAGRLGTLSPGARVTIRGRVTGLMMNVQVEHSILE